MTSMRTLKKKLSEIEKLWEDENYDAALSEVDKLRKAWPGHPKLLVLWADLVQLQDDPKHSLQEVKKTLQEAVELDDRSPAAAIELGHFLDAVEDNPRAAAKEFTKAAACARQLLIEALLGQARALLQLSKREEAIGCLAEAIHLAHQDSSAGKENSAKVKPCILVYDSQKPIFSFPLQGPLAQEIENLLNDVQAVAATE